MNRWKERFRGKEHEDYYTERPLPAVLLWTSPEFPLDPFIAPFELRKVIQEAEVKHVTGAFPSRDASWFTQQDSVIIKNPGLEGSSHLEVSTWGSMLAAQELAREEDPRSGRLHRTNVFGHDLIMYPLLYLLLARNWVECSGFSATLFVSVELRHIRGVRIQGLEREWRLRQRKGVQEYAMSVHDDTVSWKRSFLASKLVF